MATYKIKGNWWVSNKEEWEDAGGQVVTVTIERADLIDGNGYVFHEGAFRVKATRAVKVNGKDVRTKTFKGETAWNDAERLAYDMGTAIRLGRG